MPNRSAAAFLLLSTLSLLAVLPSRGQPAPPRPEFALASVKPTDLSLRQQIDMRVLPNGGLTATAVTLHFLIKVAYGVQDSQISGEASWIGSEKFDILAKPEEGAKPPILPMLQALLEDRFKLVVRSTMKEAPVYELKMATSGGKPGPSLHELEPGECPAGPPPPRAAPCAGFISARNHLGGHRVKMSQLTSPLSSILGRPVLDQTGLTGDFDLDFYWTPEENISAGGDVMPVPDGVSPASIFTAIKEQLGLKLDSAKGSITVLVIDRAERPSAN